MESRKEARPQQEVAQQKTTHPEVSPRSTGKASVHHWTQPEYFSRRVGIEGLGSDGASPMDFLATAFLGRHFLDRYFFWPALRPTSLASRAMALTSLTSRASLASLTAPRAQDAVAQSMVVEPSPRTLSFNRVVPVQGC